MIAKSFNAFFVTDKRQNITCPDFDFEVFSRCMIYALAIDWGKKLF